MGEIDIKALLIKRPARDHTPRSAAYKREVAVRRAAATAMANRAINALHRDDYDELYRQAKALVDAERGPLPD